MFREEKGHDPDLIRDSQCCRSANVELVDKIIVLDKQWRSRNAQILGSEVKVLLVELSLYSLI
jgi:seryl-tRNA synthetase